MKFKTANERVSLLHLSGEHIASPCQGMRPSTLSNREATDLEMKGREQQQVANKYYSTRKCCWQHCNPGGEITATVTLV